MRVTLAVPNLLAMDRAALAAVPGLARFARHAESIAAEPAGMSTALLVAAGAPRETPVAPLAALGAGFAPGDALVQHADPVALVAGRDDVLLSGRIDDLSPADADAILAALNLHFADDGLAFHAPRPDAWFVTSRSTELPDTTPLPAVRGAIQSHLPRGEHRKTWRRFLSEMQMLVHEHPANAPREAQGRAPVTGIWLWGGGTLRDVPATPRIAMFAAPGPAGDVVRGLAVHARSSAPAPPADFASLPRGDDAIVVLPAPANAGDVAALASAWLAPAAMALERRALAQLTLVADGNGAALVWTARAPSWRQRLRARFAPRAFAFPAPDGTP